MDSVSLLAFHFYMTTVNFQGSRPHKTAVEASRKAPHHCGFNSGTWIKAACLEIHSAAEPCVAKYRIAPELCANTAQQAWNVDDRETSRMPPLIMNTRPMLPC
jgi:hypothetical protein